MKTLKIYSALFILLLLVSCSNMNEREPEISSDAKVLLSESFDNDLGKFTTYSISGDQVWRQDRNYAVMTGYVFDTKTNYANEDWLISPEIDLTKEKTAAFSFSYVTRYFNDIASSCTVWISENYTLGNPNDATWRQLTFSKFIDTQSFTFLSSGEVSLTPYVGKVVRVAFKYLSTSEKAGTWEVKNVLVTNREAKKNTKKYGFGTKNDPFSVDGAKINQGQSGWVEGVIVGFVDPNYNYVLSAENVTQTSNILLADSLNTLYLAKTMPVQLPPGEIRNGLNLQANPTILGKRVKLYGDLSNYFKTAGLKNILYYEFEDGKFGGQLPFDPTGAVYYESFKSNLGGFVTYSVLGDQTWEYNSKYKCAYISGFQKPNSFANEDWLISPEINLTGKTSAVLSFEHALRFNNNPSADATVWISENYTSGNPATATWTQLSTNFKDGADWNFVNAGEFSLAGFANKKIKIALVYKSTSSRAGTWEVKNFIVK